MQITLGTLSLTGIDDDGVEWTVHELSGWGATSSTGSFTQKPRGSGAWAGPAFATNREVALNGKLGAPSREAAAAAIDRLISAVSLTDTVLTIDEGAGGRWCTVRQSGEVIVQWINDRAVSWSVQVASADWRKFGVTMEGTTALPSTVGGLTVPFTVPFRIDAVSVTGQITLGNPGNEHGPVFLRIDGPCVGPVVTHVSSGVQLVFSSSLVLGAGEFLLVDAEKRTALANGQSSRSGYITSRGWPMFQPGDNTFAFTAAQFDAASRLTVEAVPAWR